MNCWSGLLDEALEFDALLELAELELLGAAGWLELFSEVAALLELLQPTARNPSSRKDSKRHLVIILRSFPLVA
jgi:hypothetical protein